MDRYTLLVFKMDNQQGPTGTCTWNSAQCYVAAWMRDEFGEERIHVYVLPSPFEVHSKLSQPCYSTICCYLIAKSYLTLLQLHGCMGFPRQEYWSWLPLPSPGDLPEYRH